MGGTADTGPSFDPICGDGIVEEPEECDLGELNDTGMYCTGECTSNVCGDGYVGPGEACDDGNLDNGDLCTSECGPASCGDGKLQGGEQCDAGKDNSETGACLPSCQLATCGDLFIQAGVETCDGSNIAGQTCMTQSFDGGVLVCAPDCSAFDTSNCHLCGNAVLEPGENCDGSVFMGNVTCEDFGPGGSTVANGMLVCTSSCTVIDDSGCTYCGDDMQENPEQCDGIDLGGNSCQTEAPVGTMASGGTATCNPNCTVNIDDCTYCGDLVVEMPNEDCESGMLGGQTCVSQGFDGGTLGCTSCMFNTNNCTECGDDVREGTEQCDGADLNGATCTSILGGAYRGPLTCTITCQYNTDACCLNADQPCAGNAAACCSGVCPGGNNCSA
jgi:cysteine-rich repeat protein